MSPTEEKGEVSNEFFKKLNQQIVQKDNLIKLLQLQIKNLKGHLDEVEGDGLKKADLTKLLDGKEADIARLERELAEQREMLSGLAKSKDEQIEALNRLLAEREQAGGESTETLEDPRVPELEANLQRVTEALQEQAASLEQQKAQGEKLTQQNKQLQEALAKLEKEKTALASQLETAPPHDQMVALQKQLEALHELLAEKDADLAKLRHDAEKKAADLAAMSEQTHKSAQVEQETAALQAKIGELEQSLAAATQKLAENEQQYAALQAETSMPQADPDELLAAKAQIAELEHRLVEMRRAADRVKELEGLVNTLEEEKEELVPFRDRVQALEKEAVSLAESNIHVAAAEAELEALRQQIAGLQESLRSAEAGRDRLTEIESRLTGRDQEVAQLQAALAHKQERLREEEATSEEIELLTNQVADQLLAIQKFEDHLRTTEQELARKDEQLELLQSRIQKAESTKTIAISDPADMVANFIDFFDGIDSMLARNPLPEIQALHKRLLERLIIPNQITYQPVISESFDPDRHLATDYFRSDLFPEKCIVFEVEKGYTMGDAVLKKSKVWVVQNLFACPSCQTMQSNSDSRFCHMCGTKMVAPNGLAVDSLPVFEPTTTTYLRFAERAVTQDDYLQAKKYLQEGLRIDPNFVPILIQLAEVHAHDSEFDDAIKALQRALTIRKDPHLEEKLHAYVVKNTIFQQARTLNLDPEEFQKLITLIQK